MNAKKLKKLRRIIREKGNVESLKGSLVTTGANRSTAFNHPKSARGVYRSLKRAAVSG